MSGEVLTLGNIGNDKHRRILRHISDVFDNHRGNITDNIALTKFKNSSNHIILFNSLSPDLNGKRLISVEGNDDSVLFAPIDIESIICSDKDNNGAVSLLIDKYDKNKVWEAYSDDKLIKLLLRLDESDDENDSGTEVVGFSIKFADSIKTKYRMGITLLNNKKEILSQMGGNNMDSSYDTNNTQFFQFTKPVEGVTKVIIDLEVVNTNIYEWKLNNITLYSHMNETGLKSLSESGIITYTLVPNNVFVRQVNDEFLKSNNNAKQIGGVVKKGEEGKATPAPLKMDTPTVEKTFGNTDSYGTPLLSAPLLSHQYLDRLDRKQITKLSNIKKLYSITDIPNSNSKIYTFETDPDTKNLTLTLSPTDDINRYPDEPVTEMTELVKRGYIKKGGFKNYTLTFYVKMDQITMQDQYLVWKLGGWLFNDQFPELARATDVYIPITSNNDVTPQVFTEYVLNKFGKIKEGIVISDDGGLQAPLIKEAKWIGFQFTRHIDDESKTSVIDVDINLNPTDENGNFTNLNNFQPYLQLDDHNYGDPDTDADAHQANCWSGINDIISISGAKYVSIFGLSMYETEQ